LLPLPCQMQWCHIFSIYFPTRNDKVISYNPLDVILVNASDILRFYTDISVLKVMEMYTYNSLQIQFSRKFPSISVDIFLRHAFNCRDMKRNILQIKQATIDKQGGGQFSHNAALIISYQWHQNRHQCGRQMLRRKGQLKEYIW
jgi:hypothetical protein